MALWEAIETYHALLADEALAGASQAQLDDQLRRRGLFFGQRPVCTVLRPRLFTPGQYRFLQERVHLVMQAFAKAYGAAQADRGFRAQFGLRDWEEELVQHDPGYRQPSPMSRLDAFFVTDRGGLRFMEYNAEVPAGGAYNDALTDVFLGLPVMREFLRRYALQPLPGRHNVQHALLDAYRQWGGRNEPPRLAILDWREVPTYSEFVLFAEYFQAQGLECRIVDPREVEYRDGRLRAGDFPITLLYKRVLISELIERGGLDQPVVRAVRDGAVCMVNPFRCKILHKKASLAVLSDERNADLFSRAECDAIAAHIPWTRRVEDRKTVYRGEEIDLLPFIVERREELVLKANDEYGGKGVVLGWETAPADWAGALRAALAAPAVVQERVGLTSEPYPSWSDGAVQIADRMVDTNPFVYHGAYMDGCLTRLSTEALLNVTAGGGSTVPTFLVERR
jgi:glutathionylspermidine synthase